MKKSILTAVFFLSATVTLSAQLAVSSIQNNQTELVVNDSISIKKGNHVQIYLPAGQDFVFVKQKKSGLGVKLLGQVADIAGTGAAAVGMGSGNLKVLQGATKVITTANAVNYGADAIEKINDLPISNDAKKIAGKKMQILDWNFTDDGWILNVLFDKKKYEIYLQEAVMAGEIKL
ncbi:hypothetical protein [Epilithonimonas caeni]|uniref:hypothetical protein n=1 Tax=Epilithonimonas caeni TaxID=365343 RepID=UPI00040DC668|nr:hypothetical protein [Epilithonimonas caeni]